MSWSPTHLVPGEVWKKTLPSCEERLRLQSLWGVGRLFELQLSARRVTATRGQQLNLSYTRISSRLFNSEEQQLISHTTSQYPLKNTETTQEEVAAPGKLPETPLRMDPDLLYDTRYDYEFEVEPTHHIQMETPPKEATSSYSVRCVVPFHEHQNSADVLPSLNSSSRLRVPPPCRPCVTGWRRRGSVWSASAPSRCPSSSWLCGWWWSAWWARPSSSGSWTSSSQLASKSELLPLWFLCDSCETRPCGVSLTFPRHCLCRNIYHVNPTTLSPDEEKHTLLENVEIAEDEDEKKPWVRIGPTCSSPLSLFLFVLKPQLLGSVSQLGGLPSTAQNQNRNL